MTTKNKTILNLSLPPCHPLPISANKSYLPWKYKKLFYQKCRRIITNISQKQKPTRSPCRNCLLISSISWILRICMEQKFFPLFWKKHGSRNKYTIYRMNNTVFWLYRRFNTINDKITSFYFKLKFTLLLFFLLISQSIIHLVSVTFDKKFFSAWYKRQQNNRFTFRMFGYGYYL